MVYAKDFTYNGHSLSDFGSDLVIVSFNDMIHNTGTSIINRAVSRSEITADDVITYDYGYKDVDVYRFSITVCDEHSNYLSQELIRNLTSWLFAPAKPEWLTFEPYDNLEGRAQLPVYNGVYFRGRFIKATLDDIGGINKIGVTFEFENISPYGFTQQYAWEFDLTSSTSSTTLAAVGTNVGKLVAPVILITSDSNSGGAELPQDIDNLEFDDGHGQIMSIYNLDANTAPFLIQCPANQTIAVIGDNCYYYNDDPTFDVNGMELYPFVNLVNFNFPRMISGHQNRLQFEGTGNIIMVARMYEALGV